jgi:hypothetical protein
MFQKKKQTQLTVSTTLSFNSAAVSAACSVADFLANEAEIKSARQMIDKNLFILLFFLDQ